MNEKGREENEEEKFGNGIGEKHQRWRWLWCLNNDSQGCKKITLQIGPPSTHYKEIVRQVHPQARRCM